eukprot:Awhi_evm1s7593
MNGNDYVRRIRGIGQIDHLWKDYLVLKRQEPEGWLVNGDLKKINLVFLKKLIVLNIKEKIDALQGSLSQPLKESLVDHDNNHGDDGDDDKDETKEYREEDDETKESEEDDNGADDDNGEASLKEVAR